MHALLVKHGYRGEENDQGSLRWRTRLGSLVHTLKRPKNNASASPEFANLDDAIHYLRYVSRGNPANRTFGADVLHGRELPLPERANV